MSLTLEQLAERHSGLGGSDAAPALGLSPYKSALELFLEKREQRGLSASASAALRWGTLLEPVIRQEYATATGRIVRLPTGTLRHAKHAFMLAHVDGVTDDKRVFEAKTARSTEGWGRSGTDEVPHHYLVQVQHYLAITGFAVADIAVLINGNDFRIFEVPADVELQEMIIDGENDFWTLVQKGEAPPPDFDRSDAYDLVRRLYPGTDGSTGHADEESTSIYHTYLHASEIVKQYERVAEESKARLLNVMGNASRFQFDADGAQLVRKSVTRKEYTVPSKTYIDARFTKLKEE